MWNRMAAWWDPKQGEEAAAPASVIFGALGRRPCDELVTEPKQGALTGALVEAGSAKKGDLVPAARLPVHLGPLLGVPVVESRRALFRVQHRVVGEPLPKVRHPPGGAFLQGVVLDDPLDPVPRPGLERSTIATEKSPASITYAPRPGLRPSSPGPWPHLTSCAGGSPFLRRVREEGAHVRHGPHVVPPRAGDGLVPARVAFAVQLQFDHSCVPKLVRVSRTVRAASCRRTPRTPRSAPPACRR